MIKVDNVSKYYDDGKLVVDSVSFEVHPGQTLILIGTSGSGKTTTLRMINRLVIPDRGRIYVNGEHLLTQRLESLRRGIGYCLQGNGLFPHYTVAENIALMPKVLKWDPARIADRVTSLMEKLHLSVADHMHAYPHQLSGGQQQRVGIARALAADPPVILMDEPFGSLDPITRADVRKEFRALDELKKKTVVLVTHDIQEAFELGTHICLMDKGTVQQIGTPAELLFNPANDFVRSFFEEQRLLLELKALTLSDIQPYLESTTATDTKPASLSGADSCWDALEYTSSSNTPISVSFNTTTLSIRANELMEAVGRYKHTKNINGTSTKLQ